MAGFCDNPTCQGLFGAFGVILFIIIVVVVMKFIAKRKRAARRRKWAEEGKDVVILHHFGRANFCPSGSPYPIKLETFLRMHDIKYVSDYEEPQSAKGKTPWITINGEDIADSQIAMEYLAEKFKLDLNPGLTDEQKAISRGLRFMVEQDIYWVLVFDRWILNQGQHLSEFFKSFTGSIAFDKFLYKQAGSRMLKKQAHAQGMGRHTESEIEKMGIEDLKALSAFLGSKPFMMGDQPTELDTVVFGFMCMFLYCSKKTCIYTQKIENDMPNLVQHTDRMIEKYWPDWKDCCLKNNDEKI